MPTLIDPDQIFPKRMGVYRGCLVIQYYNVETDKFKKHVIPIQQGESIQKNLENILKTPKHSVFLRRVAPQHIKVILGRMLGKKSQLENILPSNINQISQRNASVRESSQNTSKPYYSSQISKTNSDNLQDSSKFNANKQNFQSSLSYSIQQKNKQKGKGFGNQIQDSYGYSMNFDQQLSISIAKRKQQAQKVEQEIIEDYEEEFQDFEGEQILEQKPLMKDQEKQEQLRLLDAKRKQEKQKQLQKQKERQKEKQRKKAAKKLKEQFQQFDFLDDQPANKKKKKKDKSKSKSKKKDKSANKSEDTSKNTSSKAEEEVPIQQQFDFI